VRISVIVSKKCVMPSGEDVGTSGAAEMAEGAAEKRAGAGSKLQRHGICAVDGNATERAVQPLTVK
jgi:hypothetical protein